MEVKLSRSDSHQVEWPIVNSWATASRVVREYIAQHDLGAGCSDRPAFTGGDVCENGKKVGRISYNGRAWNLNGEEVV